MSGQTQTDVIVVGTGAAGLSAALAASVAGARVLVLEKAAVIGGTTAMSGGCIWVPGHHYMAAMGLSDSREAALEYIRAVSPDGWHNTEEPLWAAFVDHAPAMLKFLEAHSPTRFTPNRDPRPLRGGAGRHGVLGATFPPSRCDWQSSGPWRGKVRKPSAAIQLNYEEIVDTHFYANPKKWMLRYMPRLLWRKLRGMRTRGNALTIGLLKGCLDRGIEIWSEAAAQRLIKENGRVTGLELMRDGKTVSVSATKGVILASGGFEWNPEMMAEHFPGPVEWTASPSTNTGDGQRMAAEAGAALDRMDQALVMGTTPAMYEGAVTGPASGRLLPAAFDDRQPPRPPLREREADEHRPRLCREGPGNRHAGTSTGLAHLRQPVRR